MSALDDAARRLIEKLRGLAASLADDERTALAVLLAPGVERALSSAEPADDGRVAAILGRALRDAGIVVRKRG